MWLTIFLLHFSSVIYVNFSTRRFIYSILAITPVRNDIRNALLFYRNLRNQVHVALLSIRILITVVTHRGYDMKGEVNFLSEQK